MALAMTMAVSSQVSAQVNAGDAFAEGGPFGYWETDAAGLPVFVYTQDEFADPRALYPTSLGLSNDHFHLLGNDRLAAFAFNHGEVVIYAGERGATWLNARDPKRKRFAGGYGFLLDGATLLSTRFPDRPAKCAYERCFGIGYYRKTLACKDLKITQTIYAPFGEDTALISEARVENLSDKPKDIIWHEYWDVNPHYFGTMPEIAGKEGAPDTEGGKKKGKGLGSSLPLLGKITRLVPGEYTLSRIVAGALQGWREKHTKKFRLRTSYQDGILAAEIISPEPRPSLEERSLVDYYMPRFFLAALPGTKPFSFETRRKVAFSRKGDFTGRVEGGLVSDSRMNNPEACFVLAAKARLEPGESRTFRFLAGYEPAAGEGKQAPELPQDLPASLSENLARWKEHLPKVKTGIPWLDREMTWHAYCLRAMVTYDDYFESHIISQGSAYQYVMGLQIAARDPLQHMFPLIYLEPRLAKEVLRYTLREMDERGFIPYGIKGVGMRTAGGNPFPSDTNLYLMLALTEYVSATRDFGFLDEALPFYPKEEGKSGTVMEHMRKAFRHQMEDVGVGPHGLVKLRNSDWNDTFLAAEKAKNPDLDLSEVEREAESVLNTALASYVLPRFAALVRAYGDDAWAGEIQTRAEELQAALRKQWNGHWFNRAVLPGGQAVGGPDDRLYLSPQTWAVLADTLDTHEELALMETLHEKLSSFSPIGAVMSRPYITKGAAERPGMGTNGGVWYSLRLPLVMAYARLRPQYAWEEFLKMSLHAHAQAYPDTWIGLWSGPDAYNAPDSKRPGETWDMLPFAGGMSDFPVFNGHAHACPWFALIKLFGIQPDPEGFNIDPRIPLEEFFLETPLLALEKEACGIKVRFLPPASGPVRFQVRVEEEPVSILVNGKDTEWRREGDFARLELRVEKGESVELEISFSE